ncbi:peptidoglycan D,D-transpeptidase FtsI family protein [Paenibacillus marinisediminis]
MNRWIRIHWVTLAISAVMLAFTCRIAWLQFIDVHRSLPHDPHTLVRQSVIQRERGVVLDEGRGRIVDRNGQYITGQTVQALILFPLNEAAIQSEAVRGLSRLLNVDADSLKRRWAEAGEPIIWRDSADSKSVRSLTNEEASFLNSRNWNGVKVLPYTVPYPMGEHTPHWIGYTSMLQETLQSTRSHVQKAGAYGLERSFDGLLMPVKTSTYVHYTDAAGSPMQGLGVRLSQHKNPYYPLRLVTTIDMTLQREMGRIMDQFDIKKGAIVVLDAQTRDVVAMESRPAYNPNHIEPDSSNWNNQAVQVITPGSVFKLAIAAAALETGVTSKQEVFHCDGHYHKYGLACWKKGGHGNITLEEAFANSCNVVFAQLGERLSSKEIEQYAAQLGLTGTVGMVSNDVLGHEALVHFDGEQEGRVFLRNQLGLVVTDGGIRAQTAIGQRDVRITPLAAANAVVTILQGGAYGNPRLVSRIEDAKGNSIVSFPAQPRTEMRLRPQTAKLLMKWMRLTVTDGTGSLLQDSIWPLAGKSGTAQASAYGTELLHTWFAGYGPSSKPRYAVTVVSEDETSSGRNRATAAFKQVMKSLAEYDKQNRYGAHK